MNPGFGQSPLDGLFLEDHLQVKLKQEEGKIRNWQVGSSEMVKSTVPLSQFPAHGGSQLSIRGSDALFWHADVYAVEYS